MSAFQFISGINEDVESYVEHLTEVFPEDIGLDRRAGSVLYVDDDAIIVSKTADRMLQYYGGFEYVNSEHRVEVGDYVFYFENDPRVAKCLETFYAEVEEVE